MPQRKLTANSTDLARANTTAVLPFDQRIMAGTVSTHSLAKYQEHFSAYCVFAGTSDIACEATTLARWRTALVMQDTPRLAPDTINLKLAAIRSIMAAAAEQGYLPGHIADAFRRVRGVSIKALRDRRSPHRRTRITTAQMRALCDAPDPASIKGMRDRALLHTLASSGMRAAATADLKYPQVVATEAGAGIWIQDKNDTDPRLCLLSREAWHWIEQWREARQTFAHQLSATKPQNAEAVLRSPYIFLAFDGRGTSRMSAQPVTATAIWQIVKQYAEQLGLEHIKPHDFRRFLGTRLAAQDIRLAQKALGHRDIRTTALHYVLDELKLGQSDDLF